MTFNLPGALAFEKKTLHYEIDQVQNFLTQSWPNMSNQVVIIPSPCTQF